MRITQKHKNEILNIYQKWLDSYLTGDIDTYDSYFDDDYHFIGSTNNEEFLNRKDTTEFFRKTSDQFSGKTDLRNNIKTVELFGNIAFITHLFDAWFLNKEDWNFYGRFRFSNALHETKDGWRFIYQHFSIPDAKADVGETIGFDQISAENLQLREVINRRTKELEEKSRELQVEMALEKVRAKSLEMQHTSELQDVIKRVHRELLKLELPITGGAFIIINSDIQDELWCWGAGGTADYVEKVHVPFIDKPIYKGLIKGIKKGPGFFTEAFSNKEKVEFFEHLFKHPPYLNADDSHKNEVFSREGGYTRSCAIFRNTSIFIINHHGRVFTEFENSVLKRFGSVFEQAYTRFLDLKKAEAQAREAQFEAALERVRSRTMAMQHSNELPEAANVLFNEVRKLGIPAWSAGYNILSEDKRSSTCIMSSEGELQEPFVLPLTEHESLIPWHEAIVKNLDFFVYGQDGKDLVAHYDYMTSLPELKSTFEQFQEAELDLPTKQFNHLVRFNKGFLLFITYEEVPEAHDIFKRFGKVFEQTYTRFLDLKKAEAQAREAQIEAALERVRSRSLAMHQSNELLEVVSVLFEQFRNLGFNITKAGATAINIFIPGSREMNGYVCGSHNQGLVIQNFLHPYFDNAVCQDMYDTRINQPEVFTESYDKKTKDEYYKSLFNLTELRDIPEVAQAQILDSETLNITIVPSGQFMIIVLDLDNKILSQYEIDIIKRFSSVFKQSYTRFLDLQKAEAQAREAQIEAALERVRSRSLAMHHSSELSSVVDKLLQEFTDLEFTLTFCIINLIDEQDKSNTVWAANPETGRDAESYYMKFEDYPFHHAMWDAWKAQKKRFIYTLEGEEKKIYDEYLYSETEFRRFPVHVQEANKALERYVAGFNFFEYSGLQTVSEEPISENDLEILERFGRVFEQAYTRFLDLQKAEVQAREAQIEAALERVRSRTMGMQKSSELEEVIKVVFDQLVHLNFNIEHAGFIIDYKENDDMHIWLTDKNSIPAEVTVPYIDTPHWHSFLKAKKIGDNFFSNLYTFEEKNKFYQELFEIIPGVTEEAISYYQNCKGLAISTVLMDDVGLYIENFEGEASSAAENKTLLRFGKVFQQTYTRFRDLEKAEVQAREAQVEAALERIRSRSIGMQKSEDLADLSLELVKQVQELGVSTWFCAFNIYDEDERGSVEWGSNGQGVFPKYRTPREGIFLKYYNAGQEGQSLLVNEIGEDECPAHYEYLCSLPGVGDQLLQMKAQGISFPTSQIDHVAFFKYGYLIFITYEPVPESYEIFKRFARVFEQSYTRFLDLQKAEERAREARVETALEKVRSRTLAMEYSKEFTESSMVVFEQLLELGISPNRLFIGLIDSDLDTIDAWATNEDGTRLANHFKLEASKNSSIARMLEGWKQGKTSQIIDMQGRELQNYFKYLNEELKIPFQRGVEQKRRIQYMAYFSGGLIGLASGEEQDEDALELLERFAAVFNLTYIRFKDLKVAEANAIKAKQDLKEIKAARENAEKALTELQQTQKQLIQSEKMASLGELTAGIAHEIQNPLNFVNNFSEVSNELLDEIAEEIEKGDLDEVKEILKDIRNNLNKINHHGKRADAIVKGMLQHSRKGNSEIEPTDLNVLCDEYLRLAYHGLRAKDKSFNADLETDFDPDLGNIPVMAQEIGRVILNLLTNAFYAVLQKRNNSNDSLYVPKVSISTHKEAIQVLIRVKDNGCGIPKKNLDKIFQPFFTTKPTGQGTGLGLSLSYDIVKAHGGVLEVETKKGKGTTFTIIINTNR